MNTLNRSQMSILLAEDNPDDVELMLYAFKKNNITNRVMVAHDGVEALDYIFAEGKFSGRNVDDKPDLILLDLNMPRVGGLEVLKKVRSNPQTCCIPVVILTSSDEESDIRKSYDYGVNSYIRKPTDFKSFTAAIKQMGLYWLELNTRPPG